MDLDVEDQESILSESVQAGLHRLWLSWHYRSRDESLIAFSNQHYYEGKLSSFPAPPRDAQGRHGRPCGDQPGAPRRQVHPEWGLARVCGPTRLRRTPSSRRSGAGSRLHRMVTRPWGGDLQRPAAG